MGLLQCRRIVRLARRSGRLNTPPVAQPDLEAVEEPAHSPREPHEAGYQQTDRRDNRLCPEGRMAHESGQMGHDRFAQGLLHVARTGYTMDLKPA